MTLPRGPAWRREAHALLRRAADCAVARPLHARQLAGDALALARTHGDRLLEAEALLAPLWPLDNYGDPLGAWSDAQRAERIFRVHGRSAQAAQCQVASARALYAMNRVRQSQALARAALQEPALPVRERVCAHVVLFNVLGRSGRIAEAYGHLNDRALPLARASGDGHLMAHVLSVKGWLYARLIHTAQNSALPLPTLADVPSLEPERLTWGQVMELFDEADALLPPGVVDWSLAIDRQYALGLSRDPGAAQQAASQLARLAGQAATEHPATAAWGHLCQAMVLHDAGDSAGALAALPLAMAVAERCRGTLLMQDLCYMLALCHEAAGQPVAALAALKRYVALMLRTLSPDDPDGLPIPGEQSTVVPGVEAASGPHRLRQPEPAHVKRAVRLIEQRLGEPLTAAAIAAGCGVSRRTLDAAFQACRATTLAAYLRGQQFDFAAEQLLRTTRPVRDIALAVGYRSPTMFAREFRRRMGLTPTQWRGMAGA